MKINKLNMKSELLKMFLRAAAMLLVMMTIVPTSCKQNPAGGSANPSGVQRTDSADSAYWGNECFKLHVKANDYYNAHQTDSLAIMLPEALKVCMEHGYMERYYNIWELMAESYVWNGQFDKAVEEAQRILDDAMKRKDDFGLFSAYSVLGIAYANGVDQAEAEKNLRKAIDHFHSSVINPVMRIYYFLCTAIGFLQKSETLDSTLTEWKTLIDKNRFKEDDKDYGLWINWNYQYFSRLSKSLLERGKNEAAKVAVDSMDYFMKLDGNQPLNHMNVASTKCWLARNLQDYKASLDYINELLDLAEERNDFAYKRVGLGEKEQTLEMMGNYREALYTQRLLDFYKDSLAMIANRDQLNELNKRFEVNELKMESERQQMQAERKQLYLIIAIILLTLIGGALFAFYRYRSAKRMAKMRAAQERIEGELQIARDIQMSMVPSTFPNYEGLDMYASMTPAKEVGGDLYGYVMNGSQLYFAVGDVSGKGVPASLFMAQATRLFSTMAHQGMEPAAICTRMNKELAGDDNVNGMFVTMFIGRLDLQTGHLAFCNAGHNPPVIQSDKREVYHFLEMLPNAPIGLWPELEYEGEEIETVKGRALFIYTDGLNEAENTAKEQFGDERLLDILRNTHFDSAQQVIEALEAEVEKHRNGAEPNDDLTMMGILLRS